MNMISLQRNSQDSKEQ